MRILREFIRVAPDDIDEGKKLPAALALTMALAAKQWPQDNQRGPGHLHKVTPKFSSTKLVSGEKRTEYSRADMEWMAQQVARKLKMSPAFIDAIIRTESNYNPDAVSSAGAQGIMQIIPSTAKQLGLEDPFDPAVAIPAGGRYLKQMLDRFDGDYDLAAAAYNAGPNNVEKYGGIPPFPETQQYVKDVRKRMEASTLGGLDDED